jgi:hypothetical protein
MKGLPPVEKQDFAEIKKELELAYEAISNIACKKNS